MNNTGLIHFFTQIKRYLGAIWLENDTIKFSIPKNSQNKDLDNFIIANKEKIIAILRENNILSKENFSTTEIFRDSAQTYFPLSPSQERLWFIEQYEEGTNAYHIPILYELETDTDPEGIMCALQKIVLRHEVLRSTIQYADNFEQAVQKIHDHPLQIVAIKLSSDDYIEQIKKDVNQPFDLSYEYPIRVKLYTVSTAGIDKNYLLINIHHIASDGWSMQIFQKELIDYYKAYLNKDKTFSLPALNIQYKDYAVWQKSYLTGEVLNAQLEYWKNKLSGYQQLEFTTDYTRPRQIDYKGAYHYFTIRKEVSKDLRKLAQEYGVTLNSAMLSGIAILLSKYTAQEDIVVGSVIANRHHRQTKELIGFFINTQANRILLNKSQTFKELIEQVHQDQIEAQLNQDLPFGKVVDELKIERDPSRHPIFQIMFAMESFGAPGKIESQEEKIFIRREISSVFEIEKFDLSIFIDDGQEELIGQINYATSLFHENTIARFSDHFQHLLQQLVHAPTQPYNEIKPLTTSEYDKIIHQWNLKAFPAHKEGTITDLFEACTLNSPDKIAVIYNNIELSYKQLNEKSNQLAHYLRAEYNNKHRQPLKPETMIALYLDRGLEMVIGILAVLKAGGTYVPIDPGYPESRVHYMLTEIKAEFILTKRHLIEESRSVLPLDTTIVIDLTESIYHTEYTENPPSINKPSDLAYVIYTSGTTGKPKGVMVEHRHVCSFASDNNFIDYEKTTVVAGVSNYAFDGSIFDIFFSLLNGKKLLIVDKKCLLDLLLLDELLDSYKVDTIFITTALFNSLIRNHSQCLHNLKQLLFGGERCNIEIVNEFKRKFENTCLVHVYGPTENIVYATFCNLSNYDTHYLAPIGKGLSDKKLYVLDRHLNPVPIGVSGELYIGGEGVARGYLSQPQLTMERFIPNPFATEDDRRRGDTRLYKTGDLVKWLQDGNIEYIGRNDNQVKIRGHRIELGEIEHALDQLNGIQQAFVTTRERNIEGGTTKYLVAYYITDKNELITNITVQSHLAKVLPEYMMPAFIIEMESFPLTANGKIDKQKLEAVEFNFSQENHVAPKTEIEKDLCRIWQEVLMLDNISTKDNFFRIGGDSILSIQASVKIRQAGYTCRVKDIFDYNTIAKLSEHLSKNFKTHTLSEQGLLTGALGLLPIQQWFLNKADRKEFGDPNYWNQSFLIRVPVLDEKKLENVMAEIISYHDILRTKYTQQSTERDNVNWTQTYQMQIPIPEFKVLDKSKHTEEQVLQLLTDWQSGFDLEQGPLFQAGYIYGYEDGSARIFLALHHLIVDGVSWRILAEDIKSLYYGIRLPPKGSSYRQWVESVANYILKHPSEADYWEAQLKDIPQYEQEGINETSTAFFELDESITKRLLHQSPKAFNTEVNDLLLAAFGYALREINHSNKQGLTLEGHGRENTDSSIDHSKTVGWYTTMFPIKLELEKELRESIQSVKESLRNIPNKGIGFGAFAVSKTTNYSFDDLVPVSFNYLGQFDKKGGDWQIVSGRSGNSISAANRDTNLINVYGLVSDGKLMFTITTGLGENITKKLSNYFKKHLRSVIDYCCVQHDKEGISYTPSDFQSVKITQSLLNGLTTKARSNRNEIVQIYPANSLQQGFIYHVLRESEDDAYRIQVLYEYPDELNIQQYIQAWEYCIEQYPILRTAFNWDEGIIQITYKYGKLEHHLHDISHLAHQNERDMAIQVIQQGDRKKGFDLTHPTLLRIHVIKQTETFYCVLKSMHHSIIDGWSESVLLNSLHNYYQQLRNDLRVIVKEDITYLQTQEYTNKNKSLVQNYWNALMKDVEAANDINALLDKPIDLRSYKRIEQPRRKSFEISGELYDQLKTFTQSEGITTNVVIQFMWHKLIQVYSGSQKSIVGTTVSGRDIPVDGIEESVGLYINTLPLIIDWANSNSIRIQLHEIQKKITELSSYSFADLAKLKKTDESLFHSLFVYENFPAWKPGKETPTMTVKDVVEKGSYPLGITVYESTKSLMIHLDYDAIYLTEKRVDMLFSVLKDIVRKVVENPDKPHFQLTLLNQQDYDAIIYKWNATDKVYQKGETIVDLFYQQVIKTPDNIAVVCGENKISYQQLNDLSTRLAEHFKTTYSISANDLIGVMLDRSEQMLIAMLGILKAGAAYVVIDPEYPKARKEFIITDASLTLLITQVDYFFNLDFFQGNLFSIDVQLYTLPETQCSTHSIKSDDLAYVLYTSGTTGIPKGVMISHRSVVNYVNNVSDVFLPDIKNIDFSTNVAFDLTVTTTICSLLTGKTIFIYTGEISTTDLYAKHLIQNKIDFIKSTPSLLSNLPLDYFVDYKIKQAIVGGEKLEEAHFVHICKFVNTIIDEYGPTEATVGTTYIHKSTSSSLKSIGKPYFNCKVYVLNSTKNPVPIGVTGELYIGGAGVAIGYLNRHHLTNERFIDNPFATASDKANGYTRLYKTGDQVRWSADGNLEYLGRNDTQIKVRGYRVELGEIEHALTQVKGIKQACVITKERKGTAITTYLVGYCVMDKNLVQSDEVIRERLTEILPEYMIPNTLITVASFPLTSNGKLDKNALPDPEYISKETYTAPINEIEQLICDSWQKILSLDKISTTEDFFRMGGDSILSIQVSSRLRQVGYLCEVKDIFEYKTISRLATYLTSKKVNAVIKNEQGNLTGPLALVPIQRWFLEKVNSGQIPYYNFWNQSFMIKVPELDKKKLEAVMVELVNYHDILRVRYIRGKNNKTGEVEWKQLYQPQISIPTLDSLDISRHTFNDVQKQLTDWQNHFDIEQGPLFKLAYLHGYEDNSARIYLAFHHLIIDSFSWRILTENIKMLYDGKQLPLKGSSYRQWAESIKTYSKRNPDEANYWAGLMNKLPESATENKQESNVAFFNLSEELTQDLLQEASKAYNTEINDLLLTALAYALKEMNQSKIQYITLEGHGRENIDPSIDHSRTLGWFTTMFPVRLELQANLKDSIQFMKETLRNIPCKGIGFGAFACKNTPIFTFNDLIPISFNYLGQFNTQEGEWQIVSEASGESTHPSNYDLNCININGMVNNGKLSFSIATKMEKELTEQLSDNFKKQLLHVISHCNEKLKSGESNYTPSDFDEFIPYEIVNPELNEDPIFIFPPGNGGAESYYNSLVPALKNRKLILFNNYYTFMKNKDETYYSRETIEGVSKYYRLWIGKLQPKGKYTFIGWSFGGVIAFEVYRQLAPKGKKINDLILLDSFFAFREVEKSIPPQYIQRYRDDINYRYYPTLIDLDKLSITLFKSTQTGNSSDLGLLGIQNIYQYVKRFYVDSESNCLDIIFGREKKSITNMLNIIKLDCNHDDILDKKKGVIADYILSLKNGNDMKKKSTLKKLNY